MAILGSAPVPSQMTKERAIATLGTLLSATISGYKKLAPARTDQHHGDQHAAHHRDREADHRWSSALNQAWSAYQRYSAASSAICEGSGSMMGRTSSARPALFPQQQEHCQRYGASLPYI